MGKQIAIYKKMFIEDMISLHLRRWARFSSHREKYVIVIINIIFHLLFTIYPSHEASYKRCFGNCSSSPPTSHQNMYRTRLGCLGAEVSTNNNFCN